MSKWNISGLLCVVVAGVLFLFHHISGLMGESGSRQAVAIFDLVKDKDSFNWIDSVTFLGINHLLDTIVMAPLYIVLFVVGVVLLVIGGFKK